MEQDLAILQNINDTLKNSPQANQRQLAKNADISLGMMNAILGRFAERGWIMLKNVNARKLSYAVTPAGIAELAQRSRNFVKRTFSVASKYNEVLYNLISEAKTAGSQQVILYGKSYIEFLIAYTCEKLSMEFKKFPAAELTGHAAPNTFSIAGEMEEDSVQKELCEKGCVSILDIMSKY